MNFLVVLQKKGIVLETQNITSENFWVKQKENGIELKFTMLNPSSVKTTVIIDAKLILINENVFI